MTTWTGRVLVDCEAAVVGDLLGVIGQLKCPDHFVRELQDVVRLVEQPFDLAPRTDLEAEALHLGCQLANRLGVERVRGGDEDPTGLVDPQRKDLVLASEVLSTRSKAAGSGLT